MPNVKGDWVGIIYTLFTREIEQVIVPSGYHAFDSLIDYESKNVSIGRSAMIKIRRGVYDGYTSREEMLDSLMLK